MKLVNIETSSNIIKEYKSFTKSNIQAVDYQTQDIPFLGSQPLQIDKSLSNHVIQKQILMSPKLDGTRYTLFIENNDYCFINRASEVFKLDDKNFQIKTKEKGKFLFDVEVFTNKTAMTIFIFDIILFGTINKKVYKKKFSKRYQIIQDIFQNNKLIKLYSQKLLEFNCCLVPKIFFMKDQLNNYFGSDSKKDLLLRFYELFSRSYPLSGQLEFDGIIFMNKDYRYYLFPSLGYGQYKWKPDDHLTVDLSCVDGKLLDSSGKPWERVIEVSNLNNVENNKTYEFQVIESANPGKVKLNFLDLKGIREKGANSILTLESVYNALINYISLEEIMNALESKEVDSFEFMDKSKAIQFLSIFENIPFVEEKQIKEISDEIKKTYIKKITNHGDIFRETKQLTKIYTDIEGKNIEQINEMKENIKSKTGYSSLEEIKSNLNKMKKLNFYKIDDEIIHEIDDEIIQEINKLDSYLNDTELISKQNIINNLENQTIEQIFNKGGFSILPRFSSERYNMNINFIKDYEVGFKNVREPSDKDIQKRMSNISRKNIDVHYFKHKCDKLLKRLKTRKELNFITKSKTKNGNIKMEDFKYLYNKKGKGNEIYKLIEYSSLKEIYKDVKIDANYFDYNINIEFNNEKAETFERTNKGIINNPKLIKFKTKKRKRKVYTYVFSPFIKIEVVYIKEFSNRPKRNENGEILKNDDDNVILEWTKKPLRKSFIDVKFNFSKLVEETTTIRKDFIEKGKVKVFDKPNIEESQDFIDLLDYQINSLINFVMGNISF